MSENRYEVSRLIAAAAPDIFAVVSSPRGHVAIDASGMLQSADGPPVTAVGDEFVVHMDRESLNDRPLGKYDVTVVITEFVPDAEIAWTIKAFDWGIIGHVYGYRLAPAEGGTLVTAYQDWSAIPEERRGRFPLIKEANLRATLGILARTVEQA